MMPTKLIDFLQSELAIPTESIALALRIGQPVPNQFPNPNQFPIILWQYGLISLEQLDRIFDWLETAI
ncbi:MAG: DUF2949 domain-containing protein [Xenococcaceae cyanobacterium]